MTTRSTTLFVGVVTLAKLEQAYVSPPDRVTLVKAAAFTNYGGTVTHARLLLGRPGLGDVVVIYDSDLAASSSAQLQTWHVLMPNDWLSLTASTGSFWTWISGAQLPAFS